MKRLLRVFGIFDKEFHRARETGGIFDAHRRAPAILEHRLGADVIERDDFSGVAADVEPWNVQVT